MNWMQLTAVQAGGAICLPIFLIGHVLANHYGISSALLVIAVGNLLLMVIATVTAIYGFESQKSTAECAGERFGSIGKKFFSLALVLSMVGWFAVQLRIMVESMGVDSPLLLGGLMTAAGIAGIRGVGFLANASLPFMIFTIVYALPPISSLEFKDDLPIAYQGLSLVFAASIAAVIDLPTFFRHARTKKDALIAVVLLFGVVLPVLEGIGVLLFSNGSAGDFVQVLQSANSGSYWKLWVVGFILLAGWTTNSANLYSATVSLQSAFPKLSARSATLLLGIGGTLIATFDIVKGLESVLEPIGIVLASMGGVLFVCYLWDSAKPSYYNLFSWSAGCFCALAGLTLTDISVLDAFVISALCKLVILILKKPRKVVVYENN